MKRLLLFFFLAFVLVHGNWVHGQRLRVATWNVENLFDTAHDAGKDDIEFLPQSTRRWNTPRYWRKLRGITQTLAAMELPCLVALQEVENDTVLRDLCHRTALWPAQYRYAITHSPDLRGVDVALLYRSQEFRLLSCRSARVPSMQHGLNPTRDILVAEGIAGKDTLHICVVHMPSRRGNNAASRQNRLLAMQTLSQVVDSLDGKKIMVMGDFNAEPGDKALTPITERMHTLLSTDRKTLRSRRGTYYFRGVWGYLDNIFVSPALLPDVVQRAHECRFPWLLRTAKDIPHRTYGGTSYIGGISDHLPLVCEIELGQE